MTTSTNDSPMLMIKHPFLVGMEKEHVRMLLEGAKAQQFQPGEILFREGEPADSFFLIESGEIALESHCPGDGEIHIQTLHDGDTLGWSWLFAPFAWNFRARVLKPARVIRCDGGHLLVLTEEDEHFGNQLMKRIAHLAIQRLQATREQLVQVQTILTQASAMMRS